MPEPIPLHIGQFYHIYNRGNNREDIFREERNYRYFMQLYAHHVEPVADTYAYCLMRNHFHLLVRIKDDEDLTGLANLSGLQRATPSRAFSNLFNAYAKAINITYNRSGALFQRPFGRILVASDAYFLQLVAYIHHNPQKHGFVQDFRTWPYSSYQTLLSSKPTHLQRDTVLTWFQGTEQFMAFHHQDLTGLVNLSGLAPTDDE